jgi:sirohydrochlorin cobaltochelatase
VIESWLEATPFRIGEVAGERNTGGAFVLSHRDDVGRTDLAAYGNAEDAVEIARFDDAGNYRPLKTAPNLRHGWQLVLSRFAEVRLAIDLLYPGRLAALVSWQTGRITATPFRETLARQTGMYRVAATIRDEEADALIANFCRSDGGCLRTILWKRDAEGRLPSTRLPIGKFDPQVDQTGRGERALPLLCQEACNLLVAEARKVVKARSETR